MRQTDRIYSQYDIEKAYDMGLESAVVIMEKTFALSTSARKELIDELKETILKNRIEYNSKRRP